MLSASEFPISSPTTEYVDFDRFLFANLAWGITLINPAETGWRAIIGSSAILSLALLGDALLYAVLPAFAEDFALTLPWVGVMLSACVSTQLMCDRRSP